MSSTHCQLSKHAWLRHSTSQSNPQDSHERCGLLGGFGPLVNTVRVNLSTNLKAGPLSVLYHEDTHQVKSSTIYRLFINIEPPRFLWAS